MNKTRSASKKAMQKRLPSEQDASEGSILEKYVPIEKLGQGSFGRVFKAKQRHTGKIRAIKEINVDFDDKYDMLTLLREVKIMKHFSKQKHNIYTSKLREVYIDKKIANMYDSDFESEKSSQSKIYLIQDLVDLDLSKLILLGNLAKITQEHIKIIVYNLLCSLTYIHSAGIMHRDIKPANVLVNDECFVKICDFGQSVAI